MTANVTPGTGTDATESEATANDEAGPTGGMATAPDSDLLGAFRFHHPRWDRWLYYVLPVVAVLQWALVAPLSVHNRVLTSTSPGFDPLRDELVAGAQPIGFFNDFFFTVWNLFPILLWVLYALADRVGTGWIHELDEYVDTTDAAHSMRRLQRIRDHRVPAFLAYGVGVAAMAVQIPKQLGFFRTHSQLYWWDWRVSPTIFTIRDVALFFNVILVLLVFWGSFFGLLILLQAVRKGDIQPDYFHPDNAGGLLPLGNVLSVLILPWVAGAFLGVLGWFDHTSASELFFRFADVVTILICTGVAATMFVLPLFFVKRTVAEDIERIRQNVHGLVDQRRLAREIAGEEPDRMRDLQPTDHELTDAAAVVLLYQRLDSVDGWPIDNQRIVQVALLVASPGVTVLTNAINEFITTYWF